MSDSAAIGLGREVVGVYNDSVRSAADGS